MSRSCPTAPITAIVTRTSGWTNSVWSQWHEIEQASHWTYLTSPIGRGGHQIDGNSSKHHPVARRRRERARMFAYIVRRLFLMLLTLFGISVIIFVLLRVVPGNIVDILFDAAGFVDPADKANLEKELGLSQPIVI